MSGVDPRPTSAEAHSRSAAYSHSAADRRIADPSEVDTARMPAAPDLDLIRGTLDLLLLKTLSWVPVHGLAALQWIERTANQTLQVEERALYPQLHRPPR